MKNLVAMFASLASAIAIGYLFSSKGDEPINGKDPKTGKLTEEEYHQVLLRRTNDKSIDELLKKSLPPEAWKKNGFGKYAWAYLEMPTV